MVEEGVEHFGAAVWCIAMELSGRYVVMSNNLD